MISLKDGTVEELVVGHGRAQTLAAVGSADTTGGRLRGEISRLRGELATRYGGDASLAELAVLRLALAVRKPGWNHMISVDIIWFPPGFVRSPSRSAAAAAAAAGSAPTVAGRRMPVVSPPARG